MDERTLILATIGVFMAVCLLMGYWASRRTQSAGDFFVAGKNVGLVVLAFASFSTILSGFGFIGGPALVYKYGTSSFWITLPAVLGFAITTMLLARRFKVLADLFDILTLPDAVAVRYRSETCRVLAALVIMLGVIAYLGTQILAFGTVASNFFEIDFVLATVIGMAVVIVYAVWGGVLAGLYTDVFQGVIMLLASLGLCWLAMTSAGEGSFLRGPENITRALTLAGEPEAVGPWGVLGPLACLSFMFLFALGGSGQPHTITKYLMQRDMSAVRWGGLLAALGYLMCALLWVTVGFAMKYLAVTGAIEPLATGREDDAVPVFLLNYAPPWLAGIAFAGLFAAIMSTADAFLNIGAGVVVRDLPLAILNRPVRNELKWARVATLLIAVFATVFALWARDRGDLIAILGMFGWGLFAAAFVPMVSVGFNWKRATWQGAAAAAIAGIVTNVFLDLAKKYPSSAPLYQVPGGVSIGAVALMVSLLVFIVVSLLTRPTPLDERTEAALEI